MVLSDKARATQERILNAAMELFHLHGYNATGLDKVIKQAGVTKGNFYYHFKSKEALALATLDWQFELVQKEMKKQVFDKKEKPLKTLFSVLEMMAQKQKEQHLEGHVRGCYFGNFTLELSTTSQAIRDKVKSIFQQYADLIESLLIMARDTGEITKKVDPRQLSLVILGQLEGAILLDKANQQPQNVDNSIAFIKQLLTD